MGRSMAVNPSIRVLARVRRHRLANTTPSASDKIDIFMMVLLILPTLMNIDDERRELNLEKVYLIEAER
jgi:hypothetical protein